MSMILRLGIPTLNMKHIKKKSILNKKPWKFIINLQLIIISKSNIFQDNSNWMLKIILKDKLRKKNYNELSAQNIVK